MCIQLIRIMGTLFITESCSFYLRTLSLRQFLRCTICGKLLLLAIFLWYSSISNCFAHQNQQGQNSYDGRFVNQEEAKSVVLEANTRLAKIPCNFTTKTNCIYVQKQGRLSTEHFSQSTQKLTNEIVVSWVTSLDISNKTEHIFGMENVIYSPSINNATGKKPNYLIVHNWIFELLGCVILASAFEVCFLVLRNIRNIGMTFFEFWSTLNKHVQKLCNPYYTTKYLNKSDQQQRRRNVAIGENRILSYIFAILTWHATQTAKCSASNTHTTSRDDSTDNVMNYEQVTTMGDLLLIILFTHVYYQRQRLEKDLSSDEEKLNERFKIKGQNKNFYQKFYDKQKSAGIKEESAYKRSLNKRCSYFCGNTYQQILSPQDFKSPQSKITLITSFATKISHLTYCNFVVRFNCCFCQHSCRICCFCFFNYRQRSYIYIPLCSTIYCCCLLKFFKNLHESNCYYLYCWQNVCSPGGLNIHSNFHCCCVFYYECMYNHSCLCNSLTKKIPNRAFNLLLPNKIKNSSLVASSDYFALKLKLNNQSYSLLYSADGIHMIVHKHNYYEVAADMFAFTLPEYLLFLNGCQSVLKWKRLQLAVVIMALIAAYASSGPNYNYQHCYNSIFTKYNLLFKSKHNKGKRRQHRRHQHQEIYRPQHHNTTPIQCIKRLKLKKLRKKFINKLSKKSPKLLSSNTVTINEHSFILTSTSAKISMVRSIRPIQGSKSNIVWLLIGLIWLEGPTIVNCNVILNIHNQQQHEHQHQQQQQKQASNYHKETTTNSDNTNFEYKTENFHQIRTKNSSNSNNNSSNSKSKNKSKNTSNNSNKNNNSNNTNNNNKKASSTDNKLSPNVIPIISAIQRVQRALKTHQNSDKTSRASSNYDNINNGENSRSDEMFSTVLLENVNEATENRAQNDLMRLESIKQQILFKLGLTRKPNVSHPLPKQFIWDTIYRADGIKSFHEFTNSYQYHVNKRQNYLYWSTIIAKGSNIRGQNHDEQLVFPFSTKDVMGNTKRSVGSTSFRHKKNSRKPQQIKQNYYNDISYYNGEKKLPKDKIFYTPDRKNLSHINKTINNFTILKQSKYQQQFHKNSQHTITAKKHQQKLEQNRRQHEQVNPFTNNNNKIHNHNNGNDNNDYNSNCNNNDNNINISNNKNDNIVVVPKHFRDNNKYIKEAKTFIYLTDINNSDGSLNSVKFYSADFDNNSIMRKQKLRDAHHEKTIDNYDIADEDATVAMDIELDMDVDIEADFDINHDPSDYIYNYNHNFNRYRNHLLKLDATDDSDEFVGNTQEIITFAEKGKMYKNHRLVEFSYQNIEDPKQKLRVKNAEIHIRIDKILKNKSGADSGIKRKRLKIWIFQLIENNYTYKRFDHIAQFCASFEVDTSRLGWQKFDITTTAKEWYSRREGDKLRLLIDCTGCGEMFTVHLFNSNREKSATRERRIADKRRNSDMSEIHTKRSFKFNNYTNYQSNQTILIPRSDVVNRRNNIDVVNVDDEDVNSSRPFLVLHAEIRRQRRVRRRAINCNGALHGQCCKESFYVSFKALGWDDWIIAPRGYFANYCRGDCIGPFRTPDTFKTFHAYFIEEYRKMGLLNGMQPCCAPIKFSSMSLIYYGDEGIIKRDLPKMVVDECGCP